MLGKVFHDSLTLTTNQEAGTMLVFLRLCSCRRQGDVKKLVAEEQQHRACLVPPELYCLCDSKGFWEYSRRVPS